MRKRIFPVVFDPSAMTTDAESNKAEPSPEPARTAASMSAELADQLVRIPEEDSVLSVARAKWIGAKIIDVDGHGSTGSLVAVSRGDLISSLTAGAAAAVRRKDRSLYSFCVCIAVWRRTGRYVVNKVWSGAANAYGLSTYLTAVFASIGSSNSASPRLLFGPLA